MTDHAMGNFTMQELGLVDAPTPEAFNALTRLAAGYFGTPVALISIVREDEDRQFFTSQLGLPQPWSHMRQTPLSHSFCQHVKRSNAPLVVSNALTHPLVATNLAIPDLGVVAYLGVPICDPGDNCIGALCIIQSSERQWSDVDIRMLSDLGRCVNDEILLRAKMLQTERLLAERSDLLAQARRYSNMREAESMAFMAPDLTITQRFYELLRQTCVTLGFDSAALIKCGGGSDQILFRYGHLMQTERLGKHLGLSVGEDRVVQITGIAPRDPDLQKLPQGTTGRNLSVPLMANGLVFGVIEFSNDRPMPGLTTEALSVLSIVACLASANLEGLGELQTLRNSEAAILGYMNLRLPAA